MKALTTTLGIIAIAIFGFCTSSYGQRAPAGREDFRAKEMAKVSKYGAFSVCQDTVLARAKDGGKVNVVYTLKYRKTYAFSRLQRAVEAVETTFSSRGPTAWPPWEAVELIPNLRYEILLRVQQYMSKELNSPNKFTAGMQERLKYQLAAMGCVYESFEAKVKVLY